MLSEEEKDRTINCSWGGTNRAPSPANHNSAIQKSKPKQKHHTYSPIHSTSFHCTPPHPQGQHRPMLVLIVSYVAQRRHAVNISPQATETLCCMWGTRPHHPPHLQDFQTKKNKFWEAHTDTLIKHGHLMCDPPEMEDGYYPYGKVDWKDLKLSYPRPTPNTNIALVSFHIDSTPTYQANILQAPHKDIPSSVLSEAPTMSDVIQWNVRQ